MGKLISLLKARGPGSGTFAAWYCVAFAGGLYNRFPNLRLLTANFVDPSLDVQPASSGASSAFDLVVESWFEGDAPTRMHEDVDSGVVEKAFDYLVTEMVEKDLPSAAERGRGIKSFVGIFGKPGQDASDARARYNAHGPLALEVHLGLGRYVRHWVDGRSAPEAPDYIGISLLEFPTREDYAERFYRNADDIELIRADVAGFLSGVERLLTTEHARLSR